MNGFPRIRFVYGVLLDLNANFLHREVNFILTFLHSRQRKEMLTVMKYFQRNGLLKN